MADDKPDAEGFEPTAEERAAGWTPEKLRAYYAEREEAAAGVVFRPKAPVRVQNSRYSVFRWRR